MYDYRTVDHTEEHGSDFVVHRWKYGHLEMELRIANRNTVDFGRPDGALEEGMLNAFLTAILEFNKNATANAIRWDSRTQTELIEYIWRQLEHERVCPSNERRHNVRYEEMDMSFFIWTYMDIMMTLNFSRDENGEWTCKHSALPNKDWRPTAAEEDMMAAFDKAVQEAKDRHMAYPLDERVSNGCYRTEAMAQEILGVLDAQSGAPWVQTYMQLQAEV